MVSDNPWGWSVTSQQQVPGQRADGAYVDGWRVGFRTNNGHTGDVWLPASTFSLDTLRVAITEKVAAMQAISGLTG